MLELRGEGLKATEGETDAEIDPVHAEPDLILMVHPECDIITEAQ